MAHSIKTILLIFLVLSGSTLILAADRIEGPVGWVDDFDGVPQDYELIRKGCLLPIKFLMPLYVGDQVTVLQNDVNLKIGMGERTHKIIWKKDGPFVIEPIGKPPTIAENVMSWVGQWLTGLVFGEATSSVAMMTRSGKSHIISPLLLNEKNWFEEGNRPFYFSWKGGAPPYTILIRTNEKPFFSREKIADPKIFEPFLDFQPGLYEIVVSDTEGYHFQSSIYVKTRGNIPDMPQQLFRTEISDDLKMTLYLKWLCTHDNGAWALEAYQQVIPISHNYTPALILLKAMEDGRLIDPNPYWETVE
jgi:hypothetical protein